MANVIGDIALVIAVSSVLGAVARRCGQPAVIGQILTGVLLGPSLLGRLPGHLTSHLFPHSVLPFLTVLAQVAVAVFMFSVGYEIDFAKLRGHGRSVPLIALAALGVPMILGIASVPLFHSTFTAVGVAHQDRSFILFMGVAVSITAMPVLASIVRERGLAGTTAGVTATAAAGIMDVVAWLLLAAALIGSGHGGPFSLPVTLLLTAVFAVFMLFVLPRLLSWWNRRTTSILASQVPLAFALAMGSAWVTTSLGLQAVFGGFLAGIALRAAHREADADVLRALDQAGGLLLPLFFIVTGLSLNIGGVGGDGFILLAIVLVAAAVGKLGPAYAVSRISGLERQDGVTVAVLVNTRGLTELIALNVGLTDGLIGQRLFTILVLMALITTMMTGPLLTLIARRGGPGSASLRGDGSGTSAEGADAATAGADAAGAGATGTDAAGADPTRTYMTRRSAGLRGAGRLGAGLRGAGAARWETTRLHLAHRDTIRWDTARLYTERLRQLRQRANPIGPVAPEAQSGEAPA